MEERERVARRLKFGEAADAYDAVRPGYPPRLVDVLIARAGLGSASRVLEIGCGTGQLTRDLVRTGCDLVCLEPDEELARLARKNFAACPRVQVHVETFERFEGAGPFDLVVAATSFHWLDPAVRCDRAWRVLRPRGTLGILTTAHPKPWTGFFARAQEVYRAIAPELAFEGASGKTAQETDGHASELARSGQFDQVETVSERWYRRFDRDQYLALLSTFSTHRRLREAQRTRLFVEIGRLIEEHEGHVDQPYETTLCLARGVR